MFNTINNAGSRVGQAIEEVTAGFGGGMNDRSSDNAGRVSNATGAADSKLTNAGIKSVQVQAENAVQSLKQKADIAHMNNVVQNAGSINY